MRVLFTPISGFSFQIEVSDKGQMFWVRDRGRGFCLVFDRYPY